MTFQDSANQPVNWMHSLNYKRIWEQICRDKAQAKALSVGVVTEEELDESGAETVALLQSLVGIKPTDEVLEIGCGIGRVGKVLSPLCSRWLGCDVASGMIEEAQSRLREFENVELTTVDGYGLHEITKRCFDLVYCTRVFMHLEVWDRYQYVSEAFRLLNPGGRFFADNIDLCSDWGWSVFENHWTSRKPTDRFGYENRPSTADEMSTYLTRAGFAEHSVIRRQGWVIGVATK